ncbi:hypothetical protein SAMN02745857_00447 [Andreprevotia lacus DSM 23236]|jgi:hypothetical protein|uniref:Uncharacterized protein n=1 Tax=Andreprevotia lacus DSM 23236 TaxID=1121001 RepID=A0A1W1X281_9NEIS|nr:hypothetical protein [Andreprevotia lacus]SMC18007.1 hypothetical protein SAMN02745857_00447 [Andreprevotia lacus DSM 23236]
MPTNTASQIAHQVVSTVASAIHSSPVTASAAQPLHLTPSDWAAWTGAIGTVLAVCVAIWVPAQQNRNARKEQIKAEKRRLKATTVVVRAVVTALCDTRLRLLQETSDPMRYWRTGYQKDIVQIGLKTMDEIRSLDLPTEKAISHLHAIKILVPRAIERLEALQSIGSPERLNAFLTDGSKESLLNVLQVIGRNFQGFAKELGETDEDLQHFIPLWE